MEKRKALTILFMALGLMVCLARVIEAAPIGTAFTYEGHLYDDDSPANDLYDFQFKLYDDSSEGSQIGTVINVPEVEVIDAHFRVELDFGSVFYGDERWLEIGVRPGEQSDPCEYTVLSPRQEVTPTPYALYAEISGSSVGDSDWTISGNDMYSGVSGNVGIGVTDPWEKLQVAGSIDTDSGYMIDGWTVLAIPGTSNTFVGNGAGELNSTGYDNTFTGRDAGFNNTTGSSNTFSGKETGYANTTGTCNTFLGKTAGRENTTGNGNTFLGFQAGRYNTTGYYNTFTGLSAGLNNTTGYDNTFTGMTAGLYNTTGIGNTFIGYQAGSYSTVASYNTFIGNAAGAINKEGQQNTYLGSLAGAYSIDPNGSGNVFIGFGAGYGATGSNKLCIGNALFELPLIYGDFDTGRVGIGTTNPTAELQVEGQVKITGGSPGEGKVLTSDSTGLATWQPISAAGDNLGNHTATQNVALNFHWLSGDGDSEGVYVSNIGNVGIGQSAPDEKLTVAGSIKASNSFEEGRAVYGEVFNSGDTENYGGYFVAAGSDGRGVYGEATNSGLYRNYGGYFVAQGLNGVGVRGTATGAGGRGVYGRADNLLGVNYAVYGRTSSPNGYSGYFEGGKNYFEGNVGIGTDAPERNLHVIDVMRLEPRASAPTSPAEGDIYMDSSTHKLMVYDGTTWQTCW